MNNETPPSPLHEPPGPLLMLRLMPDLALLEQWVSATGQAALRQDLGYALHAALRATLGEGAPKPFGLMQRPQSLQLIGYTAQSAQVLQRALAQADVTDPLAAHALGMGHPDMVVKTMPQDWQRGQVLSFETRVAPVVRSRQAAGSARPGAYPEIDVALHPDYAGQPPGNRDSAYRLWLQRELGREGAATLLSHRQLRFELTPTARRHQRQPAAANPAQADTWPVTGGRSSKQRLLPDWTARGQLRVDCPQSFGRLLARGLGRHRSFGYGCLLLAPAGAWG